MAFNGIKYIKNVTKSFGYAMVDVVGEMSPAIKSFTESNEELGKELYASVKDWKGTVKKMKTSIVESDVYEFAKAYKDNLFDDLKNGTFYNKSRIDDYNEKISGYDDETLRAEFDDMFDDEDMGLGDWDEDDLRSDLFMADTIDDVGMKIAESNAEVTARSAEYIVKGQKESTKILYEQNNKLMGQALQGMAAINANIGQLSGLPNLMEVQANNSSKFFETTTGQLNRVIELLEHISTSVDTSPEQEQQNEDAPLTFSDIVDSKGMPNLKKYFKNVQGNIKKVIDDNGGGMLGNLFGGGNVLMAFAASPLEELTKTAVKNLVPKIVENSVNQFNDTLQGFFGSVISKINKGAESDSPIMNWVQKILGIDSELSTYIDPSQYNKGKVAWDGASRKALVEIIPAQLSKIVSALTGEAPQIFDSKSGTMRSVADLYEESGSKIQRSANYAGADLRREIEKIMREGKYSFNSYSQKETFNEDLDTFMRVAFEKGGIDQESFRRDSRDYNRGLSNIGISNHKLFTKLFEIMKKSPEGRKVLLNFNKRILNERDSLTRRTRYDQENGSIETILNSGMFDSFLREEDKEENKRLRKAGFETFSSISGVQTFAKQIDDYGNNVFYYLQEILKREDKMYEYQGIMLDNWGAGGGGGVGSGRQLKGGSKLSFDREFSPIENNEYKQKETADYNLSKYESDRSKSYEREMEKFRKDNEDFADGSDLDAFEFNVDKAQLEKDLEGKNEPKNFADKLLHEKTLKGKLGAIQEKVQSFIDKPLVAFGKMLGSADQKMFDLIYGDADKEIEEKGLIGFFKEGIQNTFMNVNNWIDDKILSPIKAKLDLKEPGDLGRKIFDKFGWNYDEYKEKMKQGVFGVKDKDTGRRSGGLLGDYLQDVKDNAKGAWEWTKGGVKDVFSGVTGVGGNIIDKYRAKKQSLGQYFKGGMVDKTGIAAVSEGEIIIPSELNPYYHGKTDKAKQMRDEAAAVNRFFGGFTDGAGSIGAGQGKKATDKMAIDSAIENCEEEIYTSGVSTSSVRGYLKSIIRKAPKQQDKKVEFLSRKLKHFLIVNVSHNRKLLKGQDIEIIKEDKERGTYTLNDGTRRKKKKGEYIQKDKDGKMNLMMASSNSYIEDMVGEIFGWGESIYNGLTKDNRKGSTDPENKAFTMAMDDVKDNFKDYAGAMTVGGGIGAAASLITGMFGGPLLGAAVGSAVGLTMKSNKVQEWLFGKDVDDGEGGTKHENGVLSEKTTKFIKEQLPDLAKFGLVGGAAGTLMGHPVLGTLVGSAVGYAKKSDKFANFMFNTTDENGHMNKGLLNMTQSQFEKMMQKRLPKMGAGAVLGGLVSPLPIGIVGNMLVGSAVGFASDTDKFKDFMFGKMDKDGNRQGGLLKDIAGTIINPFKDFAKDIFTDIKDWFKKDVADPIVKAIEPTLQYFTSIPKRIGRFLKRNIFDKIGKTPLFRWLGRRIIEPARKLGGKVVKGAIGLAKLPFTVAGKAAKFVGSAATASNISTGYADNMSAEEIQNEFQNNWFLRNSLNDPTTIHHARTKKMYNMYNALADMSQDNMMGLRDAITGIDDVDNSYKNQRNAIIREMNDKMLNDYNFKQRDKDKLVEMVTSGQFNPEDVHRYARNLTSSTGKKFNIKDVENIVASLSEGSDKLALLDRRYNSGEYEKDNKKNIKNLAKQLGYGKVYDTHTDDEKLNEINKQKNEQNRVMLEMLSSKKYRDILLDNLNASISKYDLPGNGEDVKNNQNEDQPASADDNKSIITDFNKNQDERHKETIDIIKQIANSLAKITNEQLPFDENGNYVNQGDGQAPSNRHSNAAPDLNLVGANHGTNNSANASVSDKEIDDEDADAIADPATVAFGGRIRKGGFAALSKGELIIPKKFAKRFYGSFANGGMIGGNKKFLNTPEGRYIFDAESDEYEAADVETRNAEQKKSDFQDAVIKIPDKIDKLTSSLGGGGGEEKKEEDRSGGNLADIVDALGLGDTKIGGIITKIIGFGGKGLKSLIGPMLASLATISFFRGDFDEVISKTGTELIKSIFGLDKVEDDNTLDKNLSQEGKNGEAGASDIIAKGALRSFLKGGKGLSRVTEFLSNHGLGITKKYFGGVNKVTGGVQNLYNKAVNGVASKITGKTAEELSDITFGGITRNAIESTETGANALGKVDDILSSGKNKIDEIKNAFKGVGKKAAKEGTEEAAEASVKKSLKNTIKESGKKSVAKLFNAIKKKLPAGVQKILPDMADNIAEEAAEQASKKAAKEGAQDVLQMIPIVGQVLSVGFAVVDFTDGYTKASSILGIENPTEGECIIAGLVNALLGLAFPISLIPVKTLVTIVADKVLPAMGVDNTEFLEKRKSFASKVSEYNSKNETDYSVEQYNSTVRNEKTAYGTAFSNIRSLFDKTYRNKLKNGLDDSGNVISGYIDTNTPRWKYWKSKINEGLDSEYAEALYINECLHDSQLDLSDERIAEYKERIAAYKATAGAKEIPTITRDLHGLIKSGSISSDTGIGKKLLKAGFGSTLPMFGGLFKSDANYGDGASSDSYADKYTKGGGGGHSLDDYSGSYAKGGVIGKSGYAALSKGELVTKSPRDAINAIFGKLFGGNSEDTAKEYEKSTDMTSFVSDLGSFDPEKDSWKDFWAKADNDKDGNALSKLLKRIVASMIAPTFALSKSMETVSGVLGISLGASDANSGTSNTSNKKNSIFSKISNTAKSAFGKVKDKVGGILSNIGGGIKKLFGGASGNAIGGVENFDSADGSFISQFSSKYKNLKYGDSTFAEEGCAPATAAMFLNNAGVGNTAEQAAKYAINKGYKVKDDGTKDAFFKDYFNSNGIPTEQAGNQKAIYNSLANGKPVVMLGQDSSNTSKKKSPFGKNPHYVLATGLDSQGNVIINDPEARRGGLKYKKDILGKVKSGITTKLAGGASGLLQRYGGGDVAAQVWYYLKQNGFTEQAAAGVMGNLKQETGMNPACEVKNVTCGIACWDFHNGRSALKDAAKKAGVEWTDLGFQLDYLMKGLPDAFKTYTGKQPHYYANGEWCWWPNKMTFDQFKALTSINEATEIFERVYEKASKPNMPNRQKYANEYYKQFTGKEGEPVSYTGSTADTTGGDDSSNGGNDFKSIFASSFNKVLGSMYGDGLVSLINGDDSSDQGSADAGTESGSTTTATVTTADGATVSQSTTIGADVAKDAANYIGGKYVWGGNTLGKGVDCSGFVQQLYKKHGFNIPQRQSKMMFTDSSTGTTIKGGTYKDLKPGDAMFFSDNGKDTGVHHVGIYAGNGHMIHAQSTKTGIVDTDLSKSSYYQKQYVGAKRFGSGSGIIDPNRVIGADKLFGGASGVSANGKSINMNNAVQAKRAAKQQGSFTAAIDAAKEKVAGTKKSSDANFNELLTVLKQIAENTSTIATICELVKKIVGIGNETKGNTTTQTTTTSSKNVDYDVSSNENDMNDLVSTLLALAKA